MNEKNQVVLLLAVVFGISLIAANTNRFVPNTLSTVRSDNVSHVPILPKLNRAKRVAIYNGQGVVKFVAGVAHPVKQVDKDQSFWFFYNVQNQWIPTTIPLYWWSFWNTTAFVSTARELRKGLQSTIHHDSTRTWLYDAIETGMEHLQGSESGTTCLLRSICEISQLPFDDVNIFSEILNAVLIPTMDNVAEKYINARDAGRAGADCIKTYNECSPRVWDFLTHVTKISI
ncbi:uncharacterized protein LOC132786268 [Drosophila nasuta]|uniref:Uncharacterized protein LOC117573299 n=1 Tax=Drosophila albomicans TaxID=7291 RepID=A0A6P8XHJ9_DROAB|nr:uncharacterized protein LOC117573299 [Drosophila albomicans]XP_060648740.1 uncharacterized protein LOC132786268 [Drosophila nasuta]